MPGPEFAKWLDRHGYYATCPGCQNGGYHYTEYCQAFGPIDQIVEVAPNVFEERTFGMPDRIYRRCVWCNHEWNQPV